MAYIRCESGGGAPVLTETLLWTNPSPSTNFSGSVTLSDDIDNYTFIKIEWKGSTTSTYTASIYAPVEYIKASTTAAKTCTIAINGRNGTTGISRSIIYQSNTQFNISNGNAVGGSTGGSNAYVIPLNIYGVK